MKIKSFVSWSKITDPKTRQSIVLVFDGRRYFRNIPGKLADTNPFSIFDVEFEDKPAVFEINRLPFDSIEDSPGLHRIAMEMLRIEVRQLELQGDPFAAMGLPA